MCVCVCVTAKRSKGNRIRDSLFSNHGKQKTRLSRLCIHFFFTYSSACTEWKTIKNLFLVELEKLADERRLQRVFENIH